MAIVRNEALLAEFRASPRCEWCGVATPAGCHPAHISARGRSSGKRVDIRCNLVALCFMCHARQHNENRNPSLEDLWKLAAKRERITVEEAKEKVWELQR